jgi:tetratricopeptide (TPR) repeat protein
MLASYAAMSARCGRGFGAQRDGRFLGRTMLTAVSAIYFLCAPACLYSQVLDDWVGKRVVQKASRFELHFAQSALRSPFDTPDDRSPFETAPRFAQADAKTAKLPMKSTDVPAFYSVLGRDGDWLLLSSEGDSPMGWVKSDRVIPAEAAIEFFTNQIRAKPDDAFSFLMCAMLRQDKNGLDAALDDYNQSIKLNPRSAFAHIGRARIWSSKKEYDKAIADYSEAIDFNARDAVAFRERASAWSCKKEYDKAIADLNEAIKLNPHHAEGYKARAIAWLEKDKPDEALRDCAQAVQLEGSFHTDSTWLRGCLRLEKNDYDKAIADFTWVLDSDPESASAYEKTRSGLVLQA